MNNLTIRARLIILGVISVLGIVISSSFGIVQLSRSNTNLQENFAEIGTGLQILIATETAAIDFKTQVQEWKNILVRGNKDDEFAKYEKAFLEKQQAVQDGLRKVLAALKKEAEPANSSVIAGVEQLIRDHANLGSDYKHALSTFDKADPEAGKKVDLAVKGKDRATAEGLGKIVAALEKGEAEHLEHQLLVSQSSYETSRNLLFALMAGGFLVSATVIFLTVRQISSQIVCVQSSMADIKSRLDLTQRIPLSGQSEMAQVAESVNGLLDEFQSVVKKMQAAGNNTSRTSDEVSHSVAQLSISVDQQNEATSSMAASVEQMAVSVTHVSESSASAEQIAKTSLSQANDGGRLIDDTIREMVAMAETVTSTSNAMEELGKQTEQIGSIAGTIKEIADQTNLLALNAAIEAARAGETGRGFAVVADEVRKLAERTTAATTEIASVIGAIQSETRSAVEEMHRVVDQVTANAEGARRTGIAITSIREGSTRVVGASSEIAVALKEQSAASDQIANQVERIASMSEENTVAMGEAKDASQNLKTLSMELHQLVDRFRV